ncbi:MAG: M43 family zinc metalloprotease [Bacteroidota bacterium]|nr:M43 family zinc metalloprotease [Bacteroidota bacterium]
MKKISSLFLFLCISLFLNAQQAGPCATMPVFRQQQQDPLVAAKYASSQSAARTWLAQHPNAGSSRSSAVITIPVVVHVVYINAAQNISDQQIYSQIAVLNADYRLLNADTINRPTAFDSLAADLEIEFCLATFDPNGNPTNGITRTSSTGGDFGGFFNPFTEDVKSAATGGADPWPADEYLNIWVCNLFPGLLGYAQFPGGAAATDGVAITYTAFGNMGTVTAPSTLGRTASHECGHYFGLYHIWGDDNDCTTGSDSIADTPNADAASSSDCNVTLNSCSNEDPYWGMNDPDDMVQNYMDYSHDSCMNMFTLGQKARMMSFIFGDSARFALISSPAGCNPLTVRDFAFDQFFSIHPNPTNGEVMVSYFGKWSAEMTVEVMDISGRTVKSEKVNSYSYTLDLSDLPAGIYSVKFLGDGGVATKKIVKQ